MILPLPGRPPLTRLASQERTIDISRARRDLGYSPVTSIDQGLEELQGT
jgi:nucleoside-diphosphate-sugar epimerase